MLKNISITLGAFFVITLVMGFILPSDYDVKRSVEINASPAQIHDVVSDLTKWDSWTPWQQADSKAKIEIGEISKGVGASQKWVGDKSGHLKITKASVDYGIDYDLSFTGEGALTKSSITYQPNGPTTQVTWNMKGEMPMPVIGAYVALIMDSMAGPTLEMGLKNLKETVEANKNN